MANILLLKVAAAAALVSLSCAGGAMGVLGQAHAAQLRPADLRVERLLAHEALGIDVAQPLLTWAWQLPPAASTRGQAAPAVHVSAALDADEFDAASLWEQRLPAGAAAALRYRGPALRSTTRVHWRVCVVDGPCATASFVTGVLAPADWHGAQWIGGRQLRSPEVALPSGRAVKSAVLTVTGLGFYEAMLNGAKVGDAVLDPGFATNYTERHLYATYDVTAQLGKSQTVVLGARVGAGKYSYSVNPQAVPGKDLFALLASLTIEFASGAPLSLVTNSSWQASPSPIVWEHLYHGEVFDNRLAPPPGWSAPGYALAAGGDAPAWSPAEVVELPVAQRQAVLSARLFPPIKVHRGRRGHFPAGRSTLYECCRY
jgi:alpha-L-rhamnosidase